MLYDVTLNHSHASKPAFQIEREARLQERHFAELRALFEKDLSGRRSSGLFQRTALLLRTFFLSF
jgi:hypothetical protein